MRAVHALQAKCQELDESRNFCAALLQSAFAGGAIGDAHENLLEVRQWRRARRLVAVHGLLVSCLGGCLRAIAISKLAWVVRLWIAT